MSEPRKVPEFPDRHPVIETPDRETSNWIAGEPSVQEMLRDPIVHSILRRDGLSLQDLLQAIALGRDRLDLTAAGMSPASDAA